MTDSGGRALIGALTIFTVCTAGQAVAQESSEQNSYELEDELILPPIVVEGATLDNSLQKTTREPASAPQAPARRGAASGPSEDVQAGAVSGNAVTPGEARRLPTTGSAVSVVTSQDLEQQQIRHAADALRSLPGVEVSQAGSFAGLTQVRIRGAEANHTLVVIDGVEVNSTTNGEFDFASLLANDIERIEVIRGPQSGLYGSNAAGGVVNIVTKSGKGPAQAILRAEGGSFTSQGYAATLSGGNDEAHGIFSFQKRKSDGFNISRFGDEDDFADVTNAFAKGGVQVFPWLKVDGVLRLDQNDGGRDADGIGPGPFFIQRDDPSYFEQRNRVAGIDATATLLDGHWVQHFKSNYSDTTADDYSFFGGSFFPYRNDGQRVENSYISTFSGDTPAFLDAHHAVTGLLETTKESFTPVTADNIERSRETRAAAIEYRGDFLDQLNLVASLRHDDNDSNVEDFTTYRVAGSYAVTNTPVRVHSSVGTGAKQPTMFELYGQIPGSFVPNPDLVPEESFGWDAGVELTLMKGRVLFDVTYFEADLENEIATDYIGLSSTAVNLPGTSHRSGEEFSAAWRIADGLTLSGAYTHLRAFDPAGLVEIRRPEHAGRVDVDYRFAEDKANIRLGVIYNGTMEDTALAVPFYTPTRVQLDSYTTVRLAGSYEFKPGMEVFARAENLFDADYQEVYGFETAPAAVYGGLKIKIGGNDS
ncbi:Vitamin B12 transporter BtuB precursor [Methyloligella halotolerans]|uniref:Vitamin B12 transporter BtuB n=1 Tax=Methyloligella halotolerans TaxID=1177755 RepID=A0A1E2S3A4_9HYPH|nr:TonB-dependent receptor [Methyloligella halotolerans]ODA68921.1 Vitamin B12 transporter BtuB precursor [Methyloligella halotolerans]